MNESNIELLPMSLLTNKLDTKAIRIQPFSDDILTDKQIELDVLRLDEIHPIVSGNKLLKLEYYLEDALKNNFNSIQTFGGFYSNHIVATAYAAKISGLQSIGIIKGSKPETLTQSLHDAAEYGMELQFVSNEEYNETKRNTTEAAHYIIPEGGYGKLGVKGMSRMKQYVDLSKYDYIISAVGTGTTAAGMIETCSSHQQFIGISALKGAYSLTEEIKSLLSDNKHFKIMHDYHFGGFGKHPVELLNFMLEVWKTNNLPTDIVYTSKTLFGILDLTAKDFFTPKAKVLMIHTGGLQGNRSLPPGSLPFL